MEKVDRYIEKIKNWKEETTLLREICLECNLEEDFKWMHPCYTFQGKNIVLIHGFKEYCALLFHKGVLLNDAENILVQQTENVQSARQIRFGHKERIIDLKAVIKTYIFEAIEVEKAGLVVKMKKTSEYEVPQELKQEFEVDPNFKTAFYNLTPGRQRGYLLYFSEAKQSKTRTSRIEKTKPKIFEGNGLNG
ncbi:YdeI/OmpD-associated family protein [Zobellia galactanivorans]|uniref:YdeI/OmpD-associated family protein n=1 Tax=Zobellia galactanivorans (strain DSM 12802 / CCUG 47099 / CIP 106680 / NCIMB 13871 / Dsij) TaxID=63186 RepID=UPI001C07D0BD|nr:YdeI/OmpD-associated family protein [Zobellia galactanivorans]MBU3024740.1 YdeI/OmpD-associated family protein [Zobellia galactanivorans]MDO6810670.1 YdeI/OmpD-associated family protein [Zobellia galactanivorans]